MERQKTIEKEFVLEGKGLHTGKAVRVFFYPAGDGEGITFVRKDLKDRLPIRLCSCAPLIFRADRRSMVGTDSENFVETTEHLLAAMWAAEIDNLRIELDSQELPVLDGSAREFLAAFKNVGMREGSVSRRFIKIKEPIWVEKGEAFLGIFPSDVFKVSYIFEHPYPAVGRQFFSEVLNGNLFQRELAPARTLWFVPPGAGSIEEKAECVRKQGYGKGADLENTLVIAEERIINTARFPDEPVRHSVVDLIGDLYLLGRPIKGRLIAVRSGHKLNLELVKKIRENV